MQGAQCYCAAEAVADDHQVVLVLTVDSLQLGEEVGHTTAPDLFRNRFPVPVGNVFTVEAVQGQATPADINADQLARFQYAGCG
ncbi:hypothetical protein D9M69_453190 [compost metagenome]